MKKSTKKKIIVVLGVFVGVGLIVWFGIFRKVGRFDTLQAVPVDAVFKVNIVSVNSVHERLHRNFIWKFGQHLLWTCRRIIKLCTYVYSDSDELFSCSYGQYLWRNHT